MLAKIVVLALIALATCEDHGYSFKALHLEPAQGYRHHYERAPVRIPEDREPAHESRYSAPENHGHAFSSQSIVHLAPNVEQEASQESKDEHVAPVYQNVQEEEEGPIVVPHTAPAKQYQSIQYAAQAPAHHEQAGYHVPQAHTSIRVSKPHVSAHPHHAQPQYSQGHEEESYYHGAQLHEAPVHHAHHAEAPIQEVPVHHVHHAEVNAHESHDEPIDYYAYPKYQYEYKVEDPHTGDNKFQHEFRDGDVVKGVYGLQEADGSIRTVEYSSDKHHGFSAVVKHSAPGQHVESYHHQH